MTLRFRTFASVKSENGFLTESGKPEVAVLVGVVNRIQTPKIVDEYLDELEFLAETAGAACIARFVQKVETNHPGTMIGKGKLEEISAFVADNEVDMVIFDEDLTPTQLRNIEAAVSVRVLDRTNLILDIFALRAQTAYAKVQVELAQYQYLLPRLSGLWTHLERQRGGIGLRGPGETEIETDRRVIRDKISQCKEQLGKIDRQMAIQRKNRGKMVRVALVGYTNVGKSTLMNLLAKSEVFAENKLFATLDTTVRKVVVENLPFLISDTVGFIRKLPHHLVESFKSTLDEVRESDLLLHVVDISHAGFEDQIEVVTQTLDELGVSSKPMILVFNKMDAFSYVPKDEDDLTPILKENISLNELVNSWMAKNNNPCIFISAKDKTNIDALKEMLYQQVSEIHTTRYPSHDFLY